MQNVLALRIFEPSSVRLVTLRRFPATLGRSVFGDVTIEVDGISLQHAVIEQAPEGFLLRDTTSRAGITCAGVRVQEFLFAANGTAVLGGVRIDFILTDAAETTLVGAPVAVAPGPRASEWGVARVVRTTSLVLGLYLLVCLVDAFRRFGDFWPPERPSEIFTDALVVFAALTAVSFFASVLIKLNTRRFHFLRILCVGTIAVVWYLALDEVGDALEYNLWNAELRSLLPSALILVSAAVTMTALLRPLFPDWRQLRLVLSAALLACAGYGLNAVKDHYRFEESDRRAGPVALGLPLHDPSLNAESTQDLLAKMQASVLGVQDEQRRVREEIDADEAGKGGD